MGSLLHSLAGYKINVYYTSEACQWLLGGIMVISCVNMQTVRTVIKLHMCDVQSYNYTLLVMADSQQFYQTMRY